MADFKDILLRLHENLNVLQEREAKYAGNAPLDLTNEIDDHKKAISFTRQAIDGHLAEAEWREALKTLLLPLNIVHEAGLVPSPPPALAPDEAKQRRELKILVDKVKEFWIEGFLKNSLHNVALLDLYSEVAEDGVAAIDNPLEQVLELPNLPSQPIAPRKKIIEIFDDVDQGLLVLGEPGSGKTITLLQLTGALIQRFEADASFGQPIPVVFNLSTWTKGQPLVSWMVEQLLAIYQIPRRTGRQWLENNRLLPVLDGLDEVRTEFQAACVEAINQFGAEFGLAGLVVASRIREYMSLPVRLTLNGAIRLQPLTPKQVDNYLTEAGDQLAALRMTLENDTSLQTLAQSPLTLGVMSLAYKGMSVTELSSQATDTVEKRRKHLFDTYVERMFKRKGKGHQPYTAEQTRVWLIWLAQQLKKHNQTIFLIEQLQPSWLPSRDWLRVYFLGSRVVGGLFGGLILCLVIISFIVRLSGGGDGPLSDRTLIGLVFSLIFGFSFGPLLGLSVGLIDMLSYKRNDESLGAKKIPVTGQSTLSIVFLGLIFALIGGFGIGLIGRLIGGLDIGLIFGTLFGLIFFGVIVGLGIRPIVGLGSKSRLVDDIQTTETLRWSWPSAFKGGAFGLLFGLVVGLSYSLLFWLFLELSVLRLIIGLGYGLIVALAGIMFGGLISGVVETKVKPNQGILLSLRNATLIGLIVGLLFGLLFGLTVGLGVGLLFGLTLGLMVGLIAGLLAALWYGGFDIIKHYTLRLILYVQNYTPRRYSQFLDYAAERIFLQKVGGGYIFIHRLLLEHFAEMDAPRLVE